MIFDNSKGKGGESPVKKGVLFKCGIRPRAQDFIKKWESTHNTENGEGEFWEPEGIAVASDGSVFVVDEEISRIQKVVAGTLSERLFEVDLTINQTNSATQEYQTSIGTLGATGKLYMEATLFNRLGQTIAKSSYPFYIIEGNTVLIFDTDKKQYNPGEPVLISGRVQNSGLTDAVDMELSFSLKLNTQDPLLIHTETFSLPAGRSHPFTFNTTAGGPGKVILTGTVRQISNKLVEISDLYGVAIPE